MFKNIVFVNFLAQVLNHKGYFESEWWFKDVPTNQGQVGKIPPQIPGKLSICQLLAPFFHLSLPTIWHPHPRKILIFRINKDRSVSLQSLEFFYTGCFLVTFYLLINTCWLNDCHRYQKSDFINFNIFETLKDSPKTSLSLKFSEQKVHD